MNKSKRIQKTKSKTRFVRKSKLKQKRIISTKNTKKESEKILAENTINQMNQKIKNQLFRNSQRGRRKNPHGVQKIENNNQYIGQILLPKVQELWINLFQIPNDALCPKYSKLSPFSKTHFNVHIFWYIISSVYLNKNMSNSASDLRRIIFKMNAIDKNNTHFCKFLFQK